MKNQPTGKTYFIKETTLLLQFAL